MSTSKGNILVFFNADFNCDIDFPKLYIGKFEKYTLFSFSTKGKEVVMKKEWSKDFLDVHQIIRSYNYE